MKSNFLALMALVAFAGVFTSCKPNEDNTVFIIEMSAVSQSVAATDIVATFKLDFTTNFNGATYTVACDANATDVSPKGQCVIAKAGKSSQDIKVGFDANNTMAAREIKVTITYAGKTLTHTITQAGLNAGAISFSPAAPTTEIEGQGATYTISVLSNSAWSIKDGDIVNASVSPRSGSAGETSVEIEVGENSSLSVTRLVSVKFTASESGYADATATWSATQAGLNAGAISFSPAAPTINIDGQGETYNISVLSNSAWSIKDGDIVNASISPSSGSAGETSVEIEVGKNPSLSVTRLVSVKFTASESGYADATATWSATQAVYIPIVSGWTTGNLTADADAISGHRVGAPESCGSYFRWGSLYTYDATNVGEGWVDEVTGAATSPTESSTKKLGYDYVGLSGTAHPGDPCQSLGANYRTPTRAQWKALAAKGSAWGTYKGVNGQFLGINASSCNNTTIAIGCIFLPAYGYRNWYDGTQYYQGSEGGYWSSSVYSSNVGYYCSFNSGGVDPDGSYYRGNGYSVRCIAD